MPASLALVADQSKPVEALAFPAEVVVLKFGSSVLRDASQAPAVASEIYGYVRAGRKVVAVVSALAGQTDQLLADARSLGLDHENELLPAYVVLGEEKAAALVAVACDRVGLDAVGLSVRELGIVAEGPAQHARPVSLKGERLHQALAEHEVVVGFGGDQGQGHRITQRFGSPAKPMRDRPVARRLIDAPPISRGPFRQARRTPQELAPFRAEPDGCPGVKGPNPSAGLDE